MPTQTKGAVSYRPQMAHSCAMLILAMLTGIAPIPKPVVIELFTARGCAACVPADRALRAVKGRWGVILLTFPVTYWDGRQKDPAARIEFTDRQSLYAHKARRELATPEFVVGGRFAFHDPDRLNGAIAAGRSDRGPAIVATGRIATVGADEVMARDATVWLVDVRPDAVRPARRGATASMAAMHETRTNVVASIRAIGSWRGEAARYRLPPGKPGLRQVVLVQGDDGGAIIAATEVR